MTTRGQRELVLTLWAVLAVSAGCVGCHGGPDLAPSGVPRELAKVSLPPYVIQSPDILVIDAVRVIPLPPYRIEPLDALVIQVTNTLPNAPIAGIYTVEPGGTVDLGFTYGSVQVAGQTLGQAKAAVEKHLKGILNPPFEVTVGLAQSRGLQQIRGEHLVRTDGTVGLGTYGNVYVDGLTIPEAKAAIEQHLSQFLLKPEISLDVSGYNSQVYYVVLDGGGAGEQVIRLPLTGKETVLDAIGLVNGLPVVASKRRIWLARPAPSDSNCDQVLPVDWLAITQRGQTATNYQVMPGDRIYVQAQPLVTIDTHLARIISPIERLLGVTLLAETTVQSFRTTSGTGVGGR